MNFGHLITLLLLWYLHIVRLYETKKIYIYFNLFVQLPGPQGYLPRYFISDGIWSKGKKSVYRYYLTDVTLYVPYENIPTKYL